MLYILDRYISPIILYITIYYRSKPKIMDTNLLINEVKVSTKTHNLPTFPHFKKITMEDIKIISHYTKRFPPYSEFSMVNIFGWNLNNDHEYCFLNNNLVIHIHDEFNKKMIFSFLGNNRIHNTIEILGKFVELKLIPEVNISTVTNNHGFIEDISNFDYIYDTKEMANITGKHFRTKRKIINKFGRIHGDINLKPINLDDYKDSIDSITLKWSNQTEHIHNLTQEELRVIKNLRNHKNIADLISYGLFHSNKFVGYIILERHSTEWIIAHFMKGDPDYTNIHDVILNLTAKELTSMGYKFMNMEQDLGIIGLRRFKTLWKPLYKLKKFTLTTY